MDVRLPAPASALDSAVSSIAAAIGEPARTRMLFSLMDGHARTATELSIVAAVSPSTASVHLARLGSEKLVKVFVQGRHRYYSLAGPSVARALERLSVLAGGPRPQFVSHTPQRMRTARTCYDHMAGTIAVSLHDHFLGLRWIEPLRRAHARTDAYASPPPEPEPSPRSALTLTMPARSAAASPMRVWTGASAVLTWAVRWVQRCLASLSPANGSPASTTAAPSPSRASASANFARASALSFSLLGRAEPPPMPCALYPVPCALRPAPCTLRPVPCALHPVPCTL